MADLDSILQKIQNQPPWNVQRFQPDENGQVVPVDWYPVDGKIVFRAAMTDADLQTQIQEVTAQIQFWGRCEASCERVVQYRERVLRVWKGRRVMELKRRPDDVPEKGWKRPTDKEVEGTYRQDSEYADFYLKIEIAKESMAATKHVREAFQIKAQMLKQFVRRNLDDGKPQLQV